MHISILLQKKYFHCQLQRIEMILQPCIEFLIQQKLVGNRRKWNVQYYFYTNKCELPEFRLSEVDLFDVFTYPAAKIYFHCQPCN